MEPEGHLTQPSHSSTWGQGRTFQSWCEISTQKLSNSGYVDEAAQPSWAESHAGVGEGVCPERASCSFSHHLFVASTRYQQILLISLGVFSFLLVLAGACYFLVLKYRGHAKYWFHSPPSIPQHIEEVGATQGMAVWPGHPSGLSREQNCVDTEAFLFVCLLLLLIQRLIYVCARQS